MFVAKAWVAENFHGLLDLVLLVDVASRKGRVFVDLLELSMRAVFAFLVRMILQRESLVGAVDILGCRLRRHAERRVAIDELGSRHDAQVTRLRGR